MMAKVPDFWKNQMDIHVFEEIHPGFEYLIRFHNDYSFSEFQIEGENVEDFLSHAKLVNEDVFIYKLVKSYEQMDV